ncbi:MAG: hypothetical protein R3A48_22560 [Polyangiales bacterium]
MSLTQVNSERRRGDVPASLAVGVLVVLVAAFLPMAQRTPAFPTELPALRDDPGAVRAEREAALRLPAPPATGEVLAAWRALSEVTARRDEAGYLAAQRLFSTRLAQATLHARDKERAIQARALDEFLRDARGGDLRDATVRLARRHQLAGGAGEGAESARTAWFSMRWERMALPTPAQGEVEPILDTLGRLPRAAQVAFASWALSAPCPALLGDGGRRGPDGVRACARLRRDMIEVARGADPRYPREEAIAATEMLLASGLTRYVSPERRELAGVREVFDDSVLHRARDEAAEALQRAIVRYEALKRARPRRMFERYEMAAVASLAALP